MSSEENNQSAEKAKETLSEIKETIEEGIEEASEKTEKAVNKSAKMVSGFINSALKLKDEKPKVFYGIVGGIVLLILIIMFSGGSSSTISGPAVKNLVIGQRYVLESPNAYDKKATVRLVSVPGTMAAYDDTEEDDRVGGCKHLKPGTPVTILAFQDAYGKKNAFANVQIEAEGECKGQTGWTLSINVN